MSAHFAHRPPYTCQHGQGETETHRRCKLEIYDSLTRELPEAVVHLECAIPGCGRPDVVLLDGDLCVAIEVQRSALSLDEIERRTEAYRKTGIHVLWLSPFPAPSPGRVTPRAWEKWCHGLYFGRVYYHAGGARVTPVHFAHYQMWVEPYETAYGNVGGYFKDSKRWRTAEPHPSVAITEMAPRERTAWKDVPAALILAAR